MIWFGLDTHVPRCTFLSGEAVCLAASHRADNAQCIEGRMDVGTVGPDEIACGSLGWGR